MAILNPSLHRRRSQPLPAILDEQQQLQESQSQPPSTPGSSKSKPEGNSPRQSFASGILIRKVSNIFSGRSSSFRRSSKAPKAKDSPNLRHAPVGHIAVNRPGVAGYSPATPSPSTESFDSDIRQPAGLGRLRTGSLSSNYDNESNTALSSSASPYERVRALSTPTLLRTGGLGSGTDGIVRRIGGGRSIPRVPQSIVNLIVSFLPTRYVTYVAVVSWAFCEAARHTLYAHLDGRHIRPGRFVNLISLLAVRHDLGLLTEALTIHVWPPSFYVDGETQVSMLASSTPSFAKALLNMHRLKSLTLPSFEYTLMRYFSPLMLTKATFLNHTMSVGDQLQLRTWLECQEEIRHLSFPVLVERPNDGPSSPLSQTITIRPTFEGSALSDPTTPILPFLTSAPSTPSLPPSPRPKTSPYPSPYSTPLPSPRIPFPQSSSSASSIHSNTSSVALPKSKTTLTPILPHLECLNATPNLTTSLLVQPPSSSPHTSKPPSFPTLHKITLRIHKSLYTGLRPSTVMGAIASRGTKMLELCFSEDIDPRTMEKVLTSVGALLGRGQARGSPSAEGQQPAASLTGLSIVVEASSAEEGIYRMINSTLARFKGLQTIQVHRSANIAQSPSFPSRTKFALHNKGKILYLPNGNHPSGISETEQTYLSSWLRCCPSLREICFASGTRWLSC